MCKECAPVPVLAQRKRWSTRRRLGCGVSSAIRGAAGRRGSSEPHSSTAATQRRRCHNTPSILVTRCCSMHLAFSLKGNTLPRWYKSTTTKDC